MEITRNQMKEALYNKKMVELFVSDIEYGKAINNFESRDEDPYFKKTNEEKAKELAKMIQESTTYNLESIILELLENDK